MILPVLLSSQGQVSRQVTSGRLLICIKLGKLGEARVPAPVGFRSHSSCWQPRGGVCSEPMLRAHQTCISHLLLLHEFTVNTCDRLECKSVCVLLLFQQRRQLHSWVTKVEIKMQFRVCRTPGYYLIVIQGFWGLSCCHELKNDSANSSLILNATALTGTTQPAAELWESTPALIPVSQPSQIQHAQPSLVSPLLFKWDLRFSSSAHTCFYSCHSIQIGKV